MIQILFDFTTHWRKLGFLCANLGQIEHKGDSGSSEAHSKSKCAFVANGDD